MTPGNLVLGLIAIAGWAILALVFYALLWADGERYDAEAVNVTVEREARS